jgi:hypothetical protein
MCFGHLLCSSRTINCYLLFKAFHILPSAFADRKLVRLWHRSNALVTRKFECEPSPAARHLPTFQRCPHLRGRTYLPRGRIQRRTRATGPGKGVRNVKTASLPCPMLLGSAGLSAVRPTGKVDLMEAHSMLLGSSLSTLALLTTKAVLRNIIQ